MVHWRITPYFLSVLFSNDVSPAVNRIPFELLLGQREGMSLAERLPYSVDCRDRGASFLDSFWVLEGHLVVGSHKNPFVVSLGERAE